MTELGEWTPSFIRISVGHTVIPTLHSAQMQPGSQLLHTWKSHQHLGVHTQAPPRLGYLPQAQPPSLFTNWCFPMKMSLAMDQPSLTLVPTELDTLITAEKLHRAASNFWLHWFYFPGNKGCHNVDSVKSSWWTSVFTGNRSSNLNMATI